MRQVQANQVGRANHIDLQTGVLNNSKAQSWATGDGDINRIIHPVARYDKS